MTEIAFIVLITNGMIKGVMSRFLLIVIALIQLVALNSTIIADSFDEFDEFSQDIVPVSDPWESYNRLMVRFNDKVYGYILRPIAYSYGAVMPKPVRQSIVRFFTNLTFPGRLISNVFQWKVEGAAIESYRFVINTTVGVFGLFDPAKSWFSLETSREDFGQMLGRWGVSSGPYFVVPFLGPSNVRDFVGFIGDVVTDPVFYLGSPGSLVVEGYDITNTTSLYIGEYEQLKRSSLDFYIVLREGYTQKRTKEISE